MSNWFISDTHFSHQRIIELCNRPFDSVEEMDEEMISRWNAVVKPSDTVFHLGDVALGKIAESLPLIGRLNGHKVLCPGNHDRVFSGEKQSRREKFLPAYDEVFNGGIIPEVQVIKIGGKNALMSHFPYVGDSHHEDRHADKRPIDNGLPLIHGHVHNAWRTNGRMFNVGVDVNDFTPVHEDVIIEWLNSL